MPLMKKPSLRWAFSCLVPLAGIELATFALRIGLSAKAFALTDLNKPIQKKEERL